MSNCSRISDLEEACKKQPALIGGINTRDGRLTQQAVAEALGLKFEPRVLSATQRSESNGRLRSRKAGSGC